MGSYGLQGFSVQSLGFENSVQVCRVLGLVRAFLSLGFLQSLEEGRTSQVLYVRNI